MAQLASCQEEQQQKCDGRLSELGREGGRLWQWRQWRIPGLQIDSQTKTASVVRPPVPLRICNRRPRTLLARPLKQTRAFSPATRINETEMTNIQRGGKEGGREGKGEGAVQNSSIREPAARHRSLTPLASRQGGDVATLIYHIGREEGERKEI